MSIIIFYYFLSIMHKTHIISGQTLNKNSINLWNFPYHRRILSIEIMYFMHAIIHIFMHERNHT